MNQDTARTTRLARLGRHLSRNIVAYVALLVAVSMTPLPAWAAATIGTAQIKNGAVTTPKLKGGAVTSPKIKARAVKSAKIADNAVTGAKIADNAVAGAKIADNAVSGAKIADDAVTGAEVKDGTIAKADLAAAAQGFTSIVTKTSTTAGVASGASHQATVTCDAGQVAISGGGYSSLGGIILLGSTGGEVTKSHPTNSFQLGGLTFSGASGDGVAPTGWRTTVKNTDADPQTVTHYAICASK